MPNTNFQTFHQMGTAISDVVKQATGRDPVKNVDMDFVTVAQNKTIGEMVITGNPASFHTGNSVPIQRLLIGMEPIQSGSGDPSPENVRPISGRTGVSVIQAGKNLFPKMTGDDTTSQGFTYHYNGDGSIDVSGSSSGSSASFSQVFRGFKILRPGIYKKPVRDENGIYVFVQYVGGSSWTTVPGGGSTSGEFEITQEIYDNYEIVIRVGVSAGTTISDPVTYYPYIYTNDVTDLTWEPPVRTGLSVTFPDPPGTVYGGTLDLVTGVLTVDRVIVDMGDLDYTQNSTYNSVYMAFVSGLITQNDDSDKIICTIYKNAGSISPSGLPTMSDNAVAKRRNYSVIYIKDPNVSDVTTLKEKVNGQKLLYPLANPVTYQLTPQELNTIAGDNVIFTDGDTLEVMYYQYGEVI